MGVEIKTSVILIGIIIAIVAGMSIVFSSLDVPSESNLVQDELKKLQTQTVIKSSFKKSPGLVGIKEYINTTPKELERKMEGKVILYDIWTYSCINCIRTLPYITTWNEKYEDDGLLIIGVHSPEFEFEKNIDNVRMAVEKHGITYPVVLDNEWETWKAFENRYWPRKYLVDHDGFIRYDHIGEGGYAKTEKKIQELLHERAAQIGINVAAAESLVDLEEFQHTNFRTPELYFGYKFASGRNQLGNAEGFQPGKDVVYTIPNNIQQNYFYIDGTWKNLEDGMKLISNNGKIKLNFFAKQVNIVIANDAELTILLDGEGIPSNYAGKDVDVRGKIRVTESDLYNILDSSKPESHTLEILVNGPGFEIFSFTFG